MYERFIVLCDLIASRGLMKQTEVCMGSWREIASP